MNNNNINKNIPSRLVYVEILVTSTILTELFRYFRKPFRQIQR
jgi:hypothetical protein